MQININGKSYSSMDEWADEEKHNPDSTSIIWEYQEATTIVNGKPQMLDGTPGKGKCWYRGKCYEGKIDYREDGIYVGGELVKPNKDYRPTETADNMESTEAKNYETLTLHGQGYTINANVINRLEIHGKGHTVRTGKCGPVEVHGMGNSVYKGNTGSFGDYLNSVGWEKVSEDLLNYDVYVLDKNRVIDCTIPDEYLKEEFLNRFDPTVLLSDADLKAELELRGWTVKCTRTTTEEL